MPAKHRREGMHAGRRPKSLEGGNRGEFATLSSPSAMLDPGQMAQADPKRSLMRSDGWGAVAPFPPLPVRESNGVIE
jgi:hypothetical protein